MDETPTRTIDAILDALDVAVQEGNLDRAAFQLEHLRRELDNERKLREAGRWLSAEQHPAKPPHWRLNIH